MNKRMAGIFVFLLLLIFSFGVKTNAQEVIAPEKRALIKELLEITEAKKIAESSTDVMLLQMERNYPEMMSQAISGDETLTEKEQEELQKEIAESYIRFSKRFRELYPQRIDLGQVIEQICYPLYDKYFTEEELKDLIAFYKSSTGKKSIKVLPQLLQESLQRSSEALNPKMIQLINEIIQEEEKRLLEMKDATQGGKQ